MPFLLAIDKALCHAKWPRALIALLAGYYGPEPLPWQKNEKRTRLLVTNTIRGCWIGSADYAPGTYKLRTSAAGGGYSSKQCRTCAASTPEYATLMPIFLREC
jgi:hypothetical protein